MRPKCYTKTRIFTCQAITGAAEGRNHKLPFRVVKHSKLSALPTFVPFALMLLFPSWKPWRLSARLSVSHDEQEHVCQSSYRSLHWYLYKAAWYRCRTLVLLLTYRTCRSTYAVLTSSTSPALKPLSALIPCPNTGKPLLTSSFSISFHLPTALSL